MITERVINKEEAKTFTDIIELLLLNPYAVIYEVTDTELIIEGFTGYAVVTPNQIGSVIEASMEFKEYAEVEEGIYNPLEQAELYVETIAPIKHMLNSM